MTFPPEGLSSFFTVWLAAVGLMVGSFLNVVIWRVPRDESIVRPRSRCPQCGRTLPWYENIPIFSWLVLRGRCRGCKARISLRYPAIEALTAGLFVACVARFDWTWELVPALVLVGLLVPLTFIDLDHWILPLSLTVPGIALGLALHAPQGVRPLIDGAVGAALGFFGFWAMEWVGRKVFGQEALGAGDKYLLAMIGAFLSYRALLGVIFLSSLQGGVVGLLLLLVRGRAGPAPDPEDEWQPGASNIPFGPWLALAAAEILLAGPTLAPHVPGGLGWLLAG